MNCWEILGIDPTRDRAEIDRAYEQQKKFADGEELDRLHQAYREASGDQPQSASSEQVEAAQHRNSADPEKPETPATPDVELSAEDRQVVREVVIQVRALLNDSRRSADAGIWRAILTEPPADQSHLRAAIAQALEPQLRPMADNGSFPPPVKNFLGDWFGWHELAESARPAHEAESNERAGQSRTVDDMDDASQPPATNFWPAVIGWIVALGILAVFFDSIFGG
jgi:hypothetical protein